MLHYSDISAYKTKEFHKWAKEEGLTDESLLKAIEEIEKGLVEAKLGAFLYKKRVATQGKGKRGSTRTLLAFKSQYRAFFLYGFSKNQRDNITPKEEKAYKIIARDLLELKEEVIKKLIKEGSLFQIVKE